MRCGPRTAAEDLVPRKPQVRHTLARIGVLVTLVLAAVLAAALYAANRRTAHMQERVAHTEQVLASIGSIREQLALIESSQRGFLLTEDPQYLDARDVAIGVLRRTAREIAALVADNAAQSELTQALNAKIEERVALAQQTIDLHRREDIEAARSFFLSGAPERSTHEILALVHRLSETENGLLRQRQAAEQREVEISRWLLMVALVAGLLVLVPACLGFVSLSLARGRAEARLLDVAESLPGAVYQLRRLGEGEVRFEFVSPRAAAVLGIEADAIRADAGAVRSRIDASDLEHLDRELTRAARDRAPFDIDYRLSLPDGSTRWIQSIAVPTDDAGEGLLWTGYWSDITQRKRDEAALREAMQRLENAQRMAQMGDWSFDFANGEVEWSRALFDLLERDPVLGPLDFDGSVALFGTDGEAAIRDAIERAIATRQTQRYELRLMRRDGRIATLDTIAVPRLDEHGEVVGLRGTMQDVTERRELTDSLTHARNQADAANRAKSQFLATMSHEIRTPMYGILGMLELLGLTPLSDDQRQSLEVVWESGRSLQRIIDDILDFSKIEAGKLDLRPEVTSVRRLVEGVRAIYSGAASSRGLALRQHIDAGISPALRVDGLRLRQILGNLVSNSLKFTEHGHVEIRVELLQREASRERLRFVVEDSGVGMTPELVEHAFVPFVQAEQRGNARGRGTGLGLAICARLAELMGGSIRIDSVVGRGTRMELDLELESVDPGELAPTLEDRHDLPWARLGRARRIAPSVEVAESRGLLVLVVDDHPINRLVLQSQLDTLGYAAETVESGEEALQALQRRHYGLVITDCNMPGMSGYELSRRLRAHEALHRLARTPIIACTANALKGEFQKCFEAGMDDYLAKPTGLPRLMDKMNRWLPLGPQLQAEAGGGGARVAPLLHGVAVDAPLDHEILRVLTGGHDAATARVLGQFKRVNDRDVATLLAAVEREDLPEVARTAHRIKGAAQLIGARALAEACAQLEALAHGADPSALGDSLTRVRQHVETLDDFLRSHAT
jgi:signal transduction histidine kinase/CHASE3 domain sensor protein/HPt (histidine-containing phosphotransfer) domain-containing protein